MFDPVALVRHVSRMVPLVHGDVITTGSAHASARSCPPTLDLGEGTTLEIEIDEIGFHENVACAGNRPEK